MVFNGGDKWNRDTNWKRATKNDLFKDTHTNTDDYKDYPLTAGDGLEYKGFVPMDFTKVVLMEGNIPWLYELKIEPSTKVLDMENVQGEAATDNIEYDMLIGSISGNQLKCVPVYGNRCNEIQFTTTAVLWKQQLLQQQNG